jgi:hypothetical protein
MTAAWPSLPTTEYLPVRHTAIDQRAAYQVLGGLPLSNALASDQCYLIGFDVIFSGSDFSTFRTWLATTAARGAEKISGLQDVIGDDPSVLYCFAEMPRFTMLLGGPASQRLYRASFRLWQLGLGPVAASPPALITSNLLAEYRFNQGSGQVLTDFSANADHGQLGTTSGVETSDPTWTTTGLSFDGGDEVQLKSSTYAGTPTFLAPLTAWTVQMVIKGAAQSAVCFYGERQLGGDQDPFLMIGSQATTNTDRPRIWLRNAATVNIFQTIPFITVLDNTWHFFAVRRNDTSLVVTVDDIEIGNTVATGVQSIDTNMTIGVLRATAGPANQFTGDIAWLATYNAALTPAQIQQNRAYVADLVASRGITL